MNTSKKSNQWELEITELERDDPRYSEGLRISQVRSQLGGKDEGYVTSPDGERQWLSLKRWIGTRKAVRLLLSFKRVIRQPVEQSPRIVSDCAKPKSAGIVESVSFGNNKKRSGGLRVTVQFDKEK